MNQEQIGDATQPFKGFARINVVRVDVESRNSATDILDRSGTVPAPPWETAFAGRS